MNHNHPPHHSLSSPELLVHGSTKAAALLVSSDTTGSTSGSSSLGGTTYNDYDDLFGLGYLPASRAVDDLCHQKSFSLWAEQTAVLDSARLLSRAAIAAAAAAAALAMGHGGDKQEGFNGFNQNSKSGFDFPVIDWDGCFESDLEEEEASEDFGYVHNDNKDNTKHLGQPYPSQPRRASLVRSLSLLSDIVNDEQVIEDNKLSSTSTSCTNHMIKNTTAMTKANPLKRRRLSDPRNEHTKSRFMVLSPHGSASEGFLDLAGRLEGTNKFIL